MKPLPQKSGLQAAIAALNNDKEFGGLSRLADGLNISRSAVSQWEEIPIRRVAEVSALTGLPRETLRPDIFGEPPARPSKRSSKPSLSAAA